MRKVLLVLVGLILGLMLAAGNDHLAHAQTDTPTPTETFTPTYTPTITPTPNIYYIDVVDVNGNPQAVQVEYVITGGDSIQFVLSMIEVGLLAFIIFIFIFRRK